MIATIKRYDELKLAQKHILDYQPRASRVASANGSRFEECLVEGHNMRRVDKKVNKLYAQKN